MSSYPDDLWRRLADLSGRLLSEEDFDQTLRRVADLAVRSISGCDSAGITMLDGGRATTRTATDGLVFEVDQYQYEIGDGPCLQAVIDRRPYHIEAMADSDRWPQFCRHAAERGINSALSLPLMVRHEPLGALNLYATSPAAFGPDDQQTGLMFASQAAVAIANASAFAASIEMTEQLREAFNTRAVIDQAIGIVIDRMACDEEEALGTLRSASQRSHEKLRTIARKVVDAAKRGSDPLAPLGP